MFAILLSLYLSFNFDNGSIIELSDGSRWIINPEDIHMTSLWLTPMEIEVQKSNNTIYPYNLLNHQLDQTVRAKKS